MFGTRSPHSILEARLSMLLGHLPAVRDGSEEAIHDARVVTRRIREGLEVAKSGLDREHIDDVTERFRQAGRAFGQARDPDVVRNLLLGLETRFPVAVAATAPLRLSIERERQRGRRRLIKQLESLDLSGLAPQLKRAASPFRTLGWRDALRGHIATRSSAVRAAVEHASGVYFPNRSHLARVAIKKLRYAIELADATGLWQPRKAIRRLKRAQETLGDAHDRQVLIQRIDALADQPPGAGRSERSAVIQFLEAEVAGSHREYVDMRPDIALICDACDRFANARHIGRSLLAAGVVLPSLVMIGRSTGGLAASGEARSSQPDAVRVRIRMS
jgi:CHAD domain-containing protein